jgi:hypothetical protein
MDGIDPPLQRGKFRSVRRANVRFQKSYQAQISQTHSLTLSK